MLPFKKNPIQALCKSVAICLLVPLISLLAAPVSFAQMVIWLVGACTDVVVKQLRRQGCRFPLFGLTRSQAVGGD